jgi:calcineurin-like phosphoesterase family protein
MRFIGDIHAQFWRYKEIIKDCDRSIQVGDFGIGFETETNPVPNFGTNHRFIRGNHDNLDKCVNHSHWIKDGTFEDGMFFIGGAFSVDQARRCEGLDWWRNEEMTVHELNEMISKYEECKPDIVVSHDCARDNLPLFERQKISTRTSQAFDAMFYIHQPKLWVFGHYHEDRDIKINGTRFVCVNKMSYKDINLGEI